jgi:cytosine/adenosine deaminase-related metal-dependent hydrolase
MKRLFLLFPLLFGLAGCVNLHVHFPQAPTDGSASAGDSAPPQNRTGGAAK